ncbi:NUDIX hydrolase [Parendozoicomonas haliclonae]|uniref:Nudix hydrolase domain-containing protein n=1 Tax=Parendozoicomonas haliclonae TaxID=1960125 RepID=A0A1X7AH28_9GAMM|nr:NUDIX domain-containing protein [Parendozoicomonas haliclonae]SMA34728.1 hypothetical protein EHSB41UT_00441 [Parendozoicomonas haliclonae]
MLNKDLEIVKGDCRLKIRCCAVIIHNNAILLHQFEKDGYWALPGGKMHFGELSEEGVRREVQEEIGYTVASARPLWIAEQLYKESHLFHELGFFYLISVENQDELYRKGEFTVEDEGATLRFKWFPLDQLSETDVRPAFLKERLLAIPNHPELIPAREYSL